MKIELKQKQGQKQWLALALLLGIGYAVYAVSSQSIKSVAAASLSFQNVENGALDLYANAYGEFASAQERLLTAPAQGKVAEILLRPGTQVKQDTVILRLSNPKLEQEVNAAKGQLAQQQAQLAAYKYEQQNERLNYQGRIADIEADIEKAQLELTVNENLRSLGVAAKIELQRAQLALKQQKKRLQFEQQKYQQFIEMQGFQLTQRNITITQQQAQLAMLQKQLADMQVTANIDGTLQALDVELGQSVQLGQALAKVGSDHELIARLRLPQHQADQIDINAPVLIDTQKGLIDAHISRIESVVNNGSVLAEAVLDGKLTANARPSLAISAQVFIKHQQDTTYVAQSTGLRPRSKQAVFVRNDGDLLQQRDITLGEMSQGKIIVLDGLNAGEQIVSSDTSNFSQFKQLSIVQ